MQDEEGIRAYYKKYLCLTFISRIKDLHKCIYLRMLNFKITI